MNPRPDRCMSIRSDIFDRDKDTTLDNCVEEVGRISAGMDYAYFLLEDKSNREVIGEANN